MKIFKQRDNGGFFSVPYAFTDAFLGILSGDAVKLYLYIKRNFSEGNEFYTADASAALRITKDACESAVEELILAGIIVKDGDNLILTAESVLREAYGRSADEKFRKLVQDKDYGREFKEAVAGINNEFFAGRMNSRWYDLIRKFAAEYGFMPETIYLLFSSCKSVRDNNPGSNFYNYVAKVGESWYGDKVVTPEDVAEREKRNHTLKEYVKFVNQKLNFKRPFTQQETAVVTGWEQKGITTEMLAVLLDDTNRVKAFTIGRIDGETAKWTEAGLKTAGDVVKYYEGLKKAAGAAREGNGSNSGAPRKDQKTQGNVKRYGGERVYNEDFFSWLEGRDSGEGAGKAPDSSEK